MAGCGLPGILVADAITRTVDRYPGRGELTLVKEMHPSSGGCAANTGIGSLGETLRFIAAQKAAGCHAAGWHNEGSRVLAMRPQRRNHTVTKPC